MSEAPPCVLVVADPGRVPEIAEMLADPLPQGAVDVLVSGGGDETIDLFAARKPNAVIVTATLEMGDTKSLIEALRQMAPRAEVGIVLVGDADGPIRTALDAIELAPDRFVQRPLAAKALRFAVSASVEASLLARRLPRTGTDQGTGVAAKAPVRSSRDSIIPPPRTPTMPNGLRARWEALADSIAEDPDDDDDEEVTASRGIPGVPDDDGAAPLPSVP
ncbi:MAG: hypothetical protein JO257_28270, partial [Deltaproteobacteria bacterium]|nr:hypothetical protein [Deltaproteobacteria bacterium]